MGSGAGAGAGRAGHDAKYLLRIHVGLKSYLLSGWREMKMNDDVNVAGNANED